MSAHSRQTDSGMTPSRISQPKTMQPTQTPASDSSAGKTTMTTPIRTTGSEAPASQRTVAATREHGPDRGREALGRAGRVARRRRHPRADPPADQDRDRAGRRAPARAEHEVRREHGIQPPLVGGEGHDGQHQDDGGDEPDGDVVHDGGEPGDAHAHIMDHISDGYRRVCRRSRRWAARADLTRAPTVVDALGAGRSADVVVLAVEPVEGVLGLVGPLVDLVGVLAPGLVVDEVAGLVEALADLVALAVDQASALSLMLSNMPMAVFLPVSERPTVDRRLQP